MLIDEVVLRAEKKETSWRFLYRTAQASETRKYVGRKSRFICARNHQVWALRHDNVNSAFYLKERLASTCPHWHDQVPFSVLDTSDAWPCLLTNRQLGEN